MSLTTDPNDPRLGRGVDDKPVPMNEAYLVLSDEERAKGFVRPVRRSYRHVGIAGPKWPLRYLTAEEKERYGHAGYVKFEIYPQSEFPATGRFWTQVQLDSVDKGLRHGHHNGPGARGDLCPAAGLLRRDVLLRLRDAPAGRRGRRVRVGRNRREGGNMRCNCPRCIVLGPRPLTEEEQKKMAKRLADLLIREIERRKDVSVDGRIDSRRPGEPGTIYC